MSPRNKRIMSFIPTKKTSDSVSFVRSTNPEVLKLSPRPGGLVSIVIPENIKPCAESTPKKNTVKETSKILQIEEKISKEFKVQSALDETLSIDSQETTLPNPIKDAMFMVGVTVSGLVMMAAGHANIPEAYPQWIKKCLECIRDDFGNHPPNVQGILNHLKYLEASGKLKPSGTEEKEPELEPTGAAVEPSEATNDETVDDEGNVTVKTTTRLKVPNE